MKVTNYKNKTGTENIKHLIIIHLVSEEVNTLRESTISSTRKSLLISVMKQTKCFVTKSAISWTFESDIERSSSKYCLQKKWKTWNCKSNKAQDTHKTSKAEPLTANEMLLVVDYHINKSSTWGGICKFSRIFLNLPIRAKFSTQFSGVWLIIYLQRLLIVCLTFQNYFTGKF